MRVILSKGTEKGDILATGKCGCWGQAGKQMGARFLSKRAPILLMSTVELSSSYKALFHCFCV